MLGIDPIAGAPISALGGGAAATNEGVGSAAGVAVALAIAGFIGAASGTSTAAAISGSVGAAVGTSTASAITVLTSHGVGGSAGSSSAAAISGSIGSAAGSSTATARSCRRAMEYMRRPASALDGGALRAGSTARREQLRSATSAGEREIMLDADAAQQIRNY